MSQVENLSLSHGSPVEGAASRRNVLDEFQRGRVCGMLVLGATRREIAQLLKVHASTIARTAERDEKFAKEIEESEALCKLRPMKAMFFAMEKHWRAAAWMLERMQPDQFGRRKGEVFARREVREVVDRLLEFVETKVTDDATREEIRLAADGFCEEIGQAPAASKENSLISIEKQVDELRAYQRERDEKIARAKVQADWEREMEWMQREKEEQAAAKARAKSSPK
jgi:hypothetical protein